MDHVFPPGVLQYYTIPTIPWNIAKRHLRLQDLSKAPICFPSHSSCLGRCHHPTSPKLATSDISSRWKTQGCHPRIDSRFVCLRNIKEIWIFFRQSLQADIVRDWRWNHKVNYIITKAAYSTKCHKYTKYSTNMPVKKTCQSKKYASKKNWQGSMAILC